MPNNITPLSVILERLRDLVEGKMVNVHIEMEESYKEAASQLLNRYHGEPVEHVVQYLNAEIAKLRSCEHDIHKSVENDESPGFR